MKTPSIIFLKISDLTAALNVRDIPSCPAIFHTSVPHRYVANITIRICTEVYTQCMVMAPDHHGPSAIIR
jgi:hypothetical protein